MNERPVMGSVFDEFGEDSSSLVFHDYYRVGEPKKLIDDCLKKERQLRISISQEDIDNSYTYQGSGYASEGEEGEEEGEEEEEDEDDDEDGDDDDDNDDEDEENDDDDDEEEAEPDEPTVKVKGTDREFETSHYAKAARAARISKLHLEIPFANGIIPSLGIYTPSRDLIDNFVPGTLDEDQLETIKSPVSPQSPHDIDPTYPSDNDDEYSYRSRSLLVSPVRFISRQRPSSPYLSKFNHNQRGKPPSRANSLPWSQKRFGAQIKRTFVKSNYQDHPRRAAIAIVKAIEHKKHHRREKREEWNQQEGIGVEAMAAMARQLTSKRPGLLALSV